uniref:Fatty acid hydroxylase domain-containing protein n=1 Tax=Aquila chrysaetos chrysaetos TaxID=223781 RepID=A0A663FGK5_AQUCH
MVHLDSLLPPNPLLSPFQAAWKNMLQHFPRRPNSLFVYQTSYLLVSLPGFIYQFIPAMKKHKIQLDKPETWEEQWQHVKISLIRIPTLLPPAFISSYFYSEDFDVPYKWDSMPPWYSVTAQCLGCFIIEDTWIYFMHRLMHHKTFYPYLHKLHHEFKTLFAMHSLYINLGEYIITGTGIFTAIHIFCKHLFMAWVWFLYPHLTCPFLWPQGHNVPWVPLPFVVNTTFHDFHRSNFHRKHSPVFTCWDKLFGTNKKNNTSLKHILHSRCSY